MPGRPWSSGLAPPRFSTSAPRLNAAMDPGAVPGPEPLVWTWTPSSPSRGTSCVAENLPEPHFWALQS